MGARALIRAFALLLVAGCQARAGEVVLPAHERVIGRARVGRHAVLLTDAPAMVTIDSASQSISRHVIVRQPGAAKLWGLGEINGALFSIEGFSDLLRVGITGTTQKVSSFDRPMGNLFDTQEGMAGQIAIDAPETPLAWSVDANAKLTPLSGVVRQGFGLSRAEESVVQLMTCSVPPRVLCWLPGSSQLLLLDREGIEGRVDLESVGSVTPARMLGHPEFRVIQDAIATARGTFIVSFREEAGEAKTALAEFGAKGHLLRRFSASHDIRLLLAEREGAMLAISSSGYLIEVLQ